MKCCASILLFNIILNLNEVSESKKFIMAYLTGSQRKAGDEEYSRPGLQISGAISLAVSHINTFHPLVDNHSLDFVVAETFGDESESIRKTATLWVSGQVCSYIGPQETCVHEARMAASFNLPMISYFCAHPETSNKNIFSTFARTRPPDTQISKSVASVLMKFEWNKVALLYSQNSERDFSAVARTIQHTLVEHNIEINYIASWSETFHYGYTENPFRELVDRSYARTRIYVIVGYYFEHLGLMLSLEEKGLFKDGKYFVVGVDIEQYDRQYPSRYFKGLLRDDHEVIGLAEKAFQSYIGVVPSPPIAYEEFAVQVNKYMQMKPFNFPNPTSQWGGLKRVPAEGAYLYDAVLVYARALNSSLITKQNVSDGKIIFQFIKDRTYKSAMGYLVRINEFGDAEGNYTLIARKRMSNSSKYGIFPIGVFLMSTNLSDLPILNLFDSVDWITGIPPLAEPKCGFDGNVCPRIIWIWTLLPAGIVLFVVSLLLIFVYRNWVYEQELDSLLWKVDYRDIISEYNPTPKSSKFRYGSQLSLISTDSFEFRYRNVYTHISLYKGRIVALKKIPKKSIEVTRNMKKEMKIMKDIRHDNLNTFIGACVDSPNICILTDYCSRGSVRDILQSDVNLDNIFISSMIGDIIKGMIYLHDSLIGSHGNLKSTNCLVDSRWVVKITDFGLHELKTNLDCDEKNNENPEIRCKNLIWKAPELLRITDAPPYGSPKADVYSFGIILYELLFCRLPYEYDCSMSYAEIMEKIINRKANEEPLRPSLDILLELNEDNNLCCNSKLECCILTMRQCWSESPDDRPDFKAIRNRLSPMRKGLKSNILDNMLDIMERYTNNLEAIVDERTYQLSQEKKKAETLLYKMLPPTVADSLRRGQSVEAESFECVTVFLSDIVGFTKMSAQSTPLEIVDFLNDLYTLFDSILESYDVYKIETIGDAYMVVSGLPVRNGDRHASEIASMALNLVNKIKKFEIRHMPSEKLLMRFGIHSGPVCAGVVGIKMPRYCLFGDTVNTASRMESMSHPLRIHCSEDLKNILDKLGGYRLIERGTIFVKGKGDMRTYWLIDENDNRKQIRQNLYYTKNGILVPQKYSNKLSITPELRGRQPFYLSTSPSLKRHEFYDENREKSRKSLLSKFQNSYSLMDSKSDSTHLLTSKSQYSLNLLSLSKNKNTKHLLQNSTNKTIIEMKDISQQSYRPINWARTIKFKPYSNCFEVKDKEIINNIKKSNVMNSSNNLNNQQKLLSSTIFGRQNLLRTGSLPYIMQSHSNDFSVISELI